MGEVAIVLEGSQRTADSCPVSARVRLSRAEVAACRLHDLASGRVVPYQATPAAGGAMIHWIVDSIAPHQRREYVLREEEGAADAPEVRLVRDEDAGRVSVTVGGEPVTSYLHGASVPKPCLYPLIGPSGEGVTRAYPQEEVQGDSTDHVHHRSVWVAWGDVNGSDNWGEEDGSGRMAHRYFEAVESGPVFGRLVALNDWLDARGERLMQDRLEYRFYCAPPSFRLFDLDVTFYASDGDVRFGDTKEGGIISVRVATPLEAGRTGRIENALGAVGEGETWGKRSPWCDYSGRLGGQTVGIAVFDHPANLRHPTYWHVRDYGLMTANPFGLSQFVDKSTDGSYVLPEGRRLCFRYRVLVHAGDARLGGVAGKYLDWVFPPKAQVHQ